jgi:imidazolonepropionase-like amidohydrolase
MKPEIMRAAIDEARKVGLRVIVHAPTLRRAKEALRARADALAHSVADAPVDQELLALMKQNRATYTSTLSLYTAFADVADWMQRLEAMDERKIISKDVYNRYGTPAGAGKYHAFMGTPKPAVLANVASNLKTVHEAGISILAGTDTGVSGTDEATAQYPDSYCCLLSRLEPDTMLNAMARGKSKLDHCPSSESLDICAPT